LTRACGEDAASCSTVSCMVAMARAPRALLLLTLLVQGAVTLAKTRKSQQPEPTVRQRAAPGDARSSLSDAKSSLSDAKSSLDDAGSSLGDTKSSPGDAKSSLGDARSSLSDAKSSLGDA
jgi:hypothetical protein